MTDQEITLSRLHRSLEQRLFNEHIFDHRIDMGEIQAIINRWVFDMGPNVNVDHWTITTTGSLDINITYNPMIGPDPTLDFKDLIEYVKPAAHIEDGPVTYK